MTGKKARKSIEYKMWLNYCDIRASNFSDCLSFKDFVEKELPTYDAKTREYLMK